MANPFDKFDAAPSASANPFDRFDEQTAAAPSAPANTNDRVDTTPDPDGALAQSGAAAGSDGDGGAFVRGAERGAVPAAGGIQGAGFGAAAMAATGLPEAALAVPVAGPVLAGGLELAGAAAGGFGEAAVISKAQQWVLDHAPAGVVKALGLDKEQQAKDQAEHPSAEFAGELAPNLLAFRPSLGGAEAAADGKPISKLMAGAVTSRALPATIMGAQEAATEEAQGEDLDPSKIAIASAVGGASNKMTRIGHFLTGSGMGPVLGLQAALRNRGVADPTAGTMRDITPEQPGPAPAGAPRLPAPIDPQDIQPGDAESPIPTSIIAAGRKVVREATTPIAQAPENPEILARNGWPTAGTPVTLDDGEGPTTTGVVHSGFTTANPDTGTDADGLHIALDSGHMFTAFKHEIDAAGIAITPQQLQQAGLPLDLATNPAAPGQPAPVVPVPEQAATPVAETAAPVQAPVQPPAQGMPVDLFQPQRAPTPPASGVYVTPGQSPEIAIPPPATETAPAAEPVLPTPPNFAGVPETRGDGTQAAPITVTHPDHVEQAAHLVNAAPSEAQAEAGNYKKLHLKVQGLPITIENPKGSVRRGVDADGKPWEVTLPASYGYIKRSTAADGEQVDAYVGPNPQSSKVFVVDQKDAKTGAYDEAKSFIGFDTREQALATYHAAFSDGLGPQRMGGIREMNTLEFKKLLNSGALDKPVAPGFATGLPAKEITTSANETGPSSHDSTPKEITSVPVEKINTPGTATFTTAKGSTYVVHNDGTTTRDKAARADVGHEGQQGPQPRSQSTFYVTKAHADELGLFQTQGGPRMAVEQRQDGTAGVKYLDGPNAGKFERRTVAKVSQEPAPGLIPVETWKGGTRVHFGNDITSVGQTTQASAKPIVKTARAPLVPTRETSVLENIRRLGGIKILNNLNHPTKEGQDILAALKDVPNLGRYINNKNGMRPDTIRESMKAQGWFGSNPEHGADIQHLYDLIGKEVREGPQFHPESERGKAAASKAIEADNARALQDVHDEAKRGGGSLTPEEAEQIVVNIGAHGINAEDAVADFIERKALRWQYEDDAEAETHAPAAPEPDHQGTVGPDRTHGQGGEESAPASGEAGRAPEDGGPVESHPGEAQSLATEPGAVDGAGKALPQTIIPGADKSAQQLAKARESSGHGRSTTSVQQKDAGGMFAPKVAKPADMFAAPAPRVIAKRPNLSIAEKLEQRKPLKEPERRALYDAYFKVGRNIEAYAGRDVVSTAPKYESDGRWEVGVREVAKDGVTLGRERFHSTAPSLKNLLEVARSDEFKAANNPSAKTESVAEPKFMPSDTQTGSANGRDFSIVAPQTPEFEAQRKLVADALRKNLDKIGLTDVGIKIADSIAMVRNGETVTTANGLHWRDIITLALHDDALETGWHEAIHALYTMGLFKKTEWAMLQAKAKSTWRDQFGVDAKWEHMKLSEEALNEEAIAEAYRAHRSGGATSEAPSDKQTSIFGRLLDRLRNALSAIRDAFNGLGFRKPEDIFASIDKGEVGGRSRPNGPTGVDREPSFSPDKPVDDHQAALDHAWDATIAATAKKLGWEGEPTSRAMFAKALLTPKGPAKTELTRNAGIIKTMEDQRASPLRPPMTPFSGTGDTKPRVLAAGIEAKAVEKKLTDSFGTLPEYKPVNMADQAARAARFLESDYEAAKAVAMGAEPPPYGVMPESVLVAVENRAIREGDIETLRQLATNSALNVEATTMGQRIRALGERDPTSPVAVMKAINDARQAAAKAKGVDPKQTKSKAVKDMLDAIKKETDKSAKRISWEKFIADITCSPSGGPK